MAHNRWLVPAALAAALALATTARAAEDPYARIKALAGTWYVVDDKGEVTSQIASIFRVTANGHSVQEIMFPGTEHEMVNMYYRDVDNVLMTHYCAGGNQPTVRLVASTQPGVIELVFEDITNMATIDDEHMHEGRYQLLGGDRLKTEWRSFKSGRASDVSRFEMVRR
jgi:hypothetical protein